MNLLDSFCRDFPIHLKRWILPVLLGNSGYIFNFVFVDFLCSFEFMSLVGCADSEIVFEF